MEWVETTGRTLEEAQAAALDQLGVDESDAEFDVVEEPRSGLFGRVRQEARVRARVRPTTPRPKVDRRERRRRRPDEDEELRPPEADAGSGGRRVPATRSRELGADVVEKASVNTAVAAEPDESVPSREEQADDARAFLEGLADAFGADGRAEIEQVDEGMIEARLVGDGLGLLIGPKGQTLAAVQELTRAAVQRGPHRGTRLRVDVGGYQQRRRVALERFTRQVAGEVRATGTATLLDPMPAADRKVVHDTVNTVEGVQSRSEGEDPRRQVLILSDESVD
ncbi:MAG: RNA-binding cell elongation regulator Jag/EloR [Acidimicrobiales bacterium]